jgi:hypothetical protein
MFQMDAGNKAGKGLSGEPSSGYAGLRRFGVLDRADSAAVSCPTTPPVDGGPRFSSAARREGGGRTTARGRGRRRRRRGKHRVPHGRGGPGTVVATATSFVPFVDRAAHPKGGGDRGRRRWRGLLLVLVQKLGPVLRGGVDGDVTLYSLPMVYTHYGVETKEEPRDVCGYHHQFFADYECNCRLGG